MLLKDDSHNQWKAVTFRPRGREMTWLRFMRTGAFVSHLLVCMAEQRLKEQRSQRSGIYFDQGTQACHGRPAIRCTHLCCVWEEEHNCARLNLVMKDMNVKSISLLDKLSKIMQIKGKQITPPVLETRHQLAANNIVFILTMHQKSICDVEAVLILINSQRNYHPSLLFPLSSMEPFIAFQLIVLVL